MDQCSRQGPWLSARWVIVLSLWLASAAVAVAQTSASPGPGVAAAAAGSADAALPPEVAGHTLNVGITYAPPFVTRGDDDGPAGLSIALWNRVAAMLDVQTRYVPRDIPGLFNGLSDGSLDIAVAALTVTEPRESRIDFSFPFYTTGLGIAVPASRGNPVWQTLSRFVSWPFLTALAALVGLLLVVGVLVWLFERHRNAEQFGGGPVAGLGSGFWWAAVTMTTVGYGDKAPRTLGGRLVGLVWMFAAIIIISSFTAAIATSLTIGTLSSGVQGVADLSHVRVMTVSDSAAAYALRQRGIVFETRKSLHAALDQLAAGETDAVVYDAPLLQYEIRHQHVDQLQVLDSTFERQDYAFALPQGSALREAVNRAILAELASPEWNQLVLRDVGEAGAP